MVTKRCVLYRFKSNYFTSTEKYMSDSELPKSSKYQQFDYFLNHLL